MRDAPPPADPKLERSVGYLVRNAHRAYDRELGGRLAPFGVLTSPWSLLRVLWREENLTQREIAARMRVERASMTRLLVDAEKTGLIVRAPHPTDRRKIVVSLTAYGRSLEGRLVPIGDTVNAMALKGFTATERAQLRALLLRVIGNLEGEPSS